MPNLSMPQPGEYPPYTIAYIQLVPTDENVLDHLQTNQLAFKQLIASIPEEKMNSAYASGKWTIKEVLSHIIDTERIFAYRALCVSRNEKNSLPGFEETDYVKYSNAKERTTAEIMAEYDSVRQATVTLFHSFNEEMLLRIGSANNNPVSTRGLAYMIAGHELHHINIIKERYLPVF